MPAVAMDLEPVRGMLDDHEFFTAASRLTEPASKTDGIIRTAGEGSRSAGPKTAIRKATSVAPGDPDDRERTTPGWGQKGHTGVGGRGASGFHRGCCTAANITTTGMMRHGDATTPPFPMEFRGVSAGPGA